MSSLTHDMPYEVLDNFATACEAGYFPGIRHYRKFGSNQDLDSGTEDVWEQGGIRTLPTVAATASIVSTSAADDGSPGGTGLQTLTIQGLDADYKEVQEEVVLNGTTPVVTSGSWIRINRMFGTLSGSGQSNAGVITASVGGNVQASISIGEGQTQLAASCIPAGHTFFLDEINLTAGDFSNGTLRLRIQTKTFGSNTWRTVIQFALGPGGSYFDDSLRPNFNEKADIRVQGISTANNVVVSAQYGGILIQNEKLTRADYEIPFNV